MPTDSNSGSSSFDSSNSISGGTSGSSDEFSGSGSYTSGSEESWNSSGLSSGESWSSQSGSSDAGSFGSDSGISSDSSLYSSSQDQSGSSVSSQASSSLSGSGSGPGSDSLLSSDGGSSVSSQGSSGSQSESGGSSWSSLSSDDGSSLSSGGTSSDDDDPEPDENGCSTDCCPESPCPIRYFNGEIKLRTTDIESGGFGLGWTHTRTYSNQIKGNDFNRGNGYNWNPENWPYLVRTSYYGNPIALMGNLYQILWFLPNGDGTYTTLYGRLEKLEHDPVQKVYRMTEPDGTVWLFNDDSDPARPGLFKSVTTPGGNTTSVTSYSGGTILEVRRSATSGSDTITESFLYEFSDGHLQAVTLRRQINSEPWQNITRALYTYYGSGASFGSLNDLETVTGQKWDGAAWVNLDVTYYRYWLGTEPKGFKHGLKYVVGPEAYAKLSAVVADPRTATDSQVALYADFYYEYDAAGRVTREQISGGSRTFDFAYFFNPTPPPSNRSDFNYWARKMVETRPDGSQTIVFMNVVGMEMLRVLKSGTKEWYRYTRYDSVGRPILVAESSAVSGYDESAKDLVALQADGSYLHLKSNEGLIRSFEYYTTTGSGAAEGYLKAERIKRGYNGTEITLREYQYTSHTAGSVTIHPVSKEIVYPDDVDPRTIETSYAYTFHDGKTQVKEKTTTLPIIPADQNGSGVANSFVDVFDEFGNLIWHKDERGFITRYQHNVETGGIVQRIEDVDTSRTADEPIGWSTPAGGGLHLITDFEHDNLGRTTQELGPGHSVDLAGTATVVRTAEWTVYKDVDHQVWTAKGFYEPGSGQYTLVNPVSITRRDRNGNVTEEIQAVRGSTSGKLVAGDSFPQSSYVRWTTHQYTDCCKLASTRVYHTIPGSGEGLRGTHYDQADFGYDVMDRRNRAVTPGGTIVSTVFDVWDQPVRVYVGTNDTGATESDPTGGGTPGNDMVLVSEREYDGGLAGGDGNLTRVTQHVDGATTRVTTLGYDWRNRQTDIDGEVDFYQRTYYDNLDRAIRVDRHNTTASGNLIGREETRYDDRGRVYQTIRYAVDAMHGTVGSSLVDNTWYDAAGNVSKSQPAGIVSEIHYSYDSLGRLVGETDPRGAVTTFGYDAGGNRISLTDAESNTTAWGYDAMGRTVKETNELGQSREFVFDSAGNLTVSTDRNGRTIELDYDAAGRVTAERWMNGITAVKTIERSYTADWQSHDIGDEVSAYSYTYDLLGRTTGVDNQGTPGVPRVVLSAAHNRASERASLSASVNGTKDFANDYSYDGLGRNIRIEQSGVSGGNVVSSKRVDLSYHLFGGYLAINRFADLMGTHLVTSTEHGYDHFGRLNRLTHKRGATILADHAWIFDADRRIESHTLPDGTSGYTYDAAGQLTAATHSFQAGESYSYDLTGNRTNPGYQTGANNRLLSDGTYDYQYDAEGNRTRRTTVATGEYVTYGWDHRNRLTSVTFKSSAGATTKAVEFDYDVFDRLIVKRVDEDGDGIFDLSQTFVYDGSDLVLVFDGGGSLEKRCLHGPDVDQVLAEDNALGEVLWTLTDNLGSVRDVVEYDAATGQSSVVNHLRYDSFGRITGQSDATKQPLFAYTGRYWDEDAQLQWNLTRWYDPAVGRWISEDPIGFEGGDANLSRYVVNSPTNFLDAFGVAPEWHHLLPQQFARYWNAAKLGYNSAEYGWILDSEYHRMTGGLHPAWNRRWGRFFRRYENGLPRQEILRKDILKQLDRMKKDFDHLLKNGKQATMSYKQWQKNLERIRRAAEAARKSKGSSCVRVLRKVGKVVKVVGVITIAYEASTGGVAVAAEGATRDALWPFLDMAEGVAEEAGGYTNELFRSGELGKQRQAQCITGLMNDPRNAPIPLRAGGLRR